MAHTFGHCLYHVVYSTKERRPLIKKEWQEQLWEFTGGIARKHGMKSMIAGGTENHLHVLLLIPPRIAPSKGVQLIKGGSSKWINDHYFKKERSFAWQEGYGIFSVGFSQIGSTRKYIRNQEEHHRRVSFEEEFQAILKKHAMEFDQEQMFG